MNCYHRCGGLTSEMNEAVGQSLRPAEVREARSGEASSDGRVAALDGLRGLAVAAVLAYHLRLRGFDAGFLGVDLFFVISGFIITARLLDEHLAAGRIALNAFYLRRLWRLFPAALVLVLLAFPITAFVAPEALPRLAADAPAALVYVSNIWQIASEQSYFESMGRDPVLRHLWSLSVEQHYYLVWPLVMVLALRRVQAGRLAVVALLLAAMGTFEMARLYAIDPLNANFTYLATHTHAMGLFVGSALGCVAHRLGWLRGHGRTDAVAPRRWLLSAAGIAALAGLGAMVHGWNVATPQLYTGGFLLASALAAVAIASALAQDGPWPRLLGCAPLRWLGTRSYSIYLWHWPLCVWIFEGPGDTDVTGARIAAIVLLSALAGEISYRFVELDARRQVRAWRERLSPALNGLSLWAGTAAAVMVASLWLPVGPTVTAPAPALQEAQAGASEPLLAATSALTGVARPVTTDASAEASPPRLLTGGGGRSITIIGDSVMLGARNYLARALPGVRVDAEVGRQFSEAPRLINALRETDSLGPTVVLHLGTNGYIVEQHFRDALRRLQDRQRVVVVDVHAARRWTEQNNEIVTRVVREFPNAVLVGWEAISRDSPHFFVQDGIHLTVAGMAAMAVAVADAAGAVLFEAPALAQASTGTRLKATRSLAARPVAAPVEAPPVERAERPAPGDEAEADAEFGGARLP